MLSAVAVDFVIKVSFTGVTAFVPSVSDAHLIRVIAPNGRVPNDDERARAIPPHVTYVMVNNADLDPSGRQPDFKFKPVPSAPTYAVFVVEGEYLSLDGNFDRREALEYERDSSSVTGPTPVANTNDTSLHWVFDDRRAVTPPPPLDMSLLGTNPDSTRVGLRLDLHFGNFAADPASISPKFAFKVKPDPDRSCQALARAAAVTMDETSVGDINSLRISSKPFRGGKLMPEIYLMKKKSDGDLKILIGNEPLDELVSSADLLSTPAIAQLIADKHAHDIAAAASGGVVVPHAFLMKRLMLLTATTLFSPTRFPAEFCVSGVFTPPTPGLHAGPTGMSGGCSPRTLDAGDPTP